MTIQVAALGVPSRFFVFLLLKVSQSGWTLRTNSTTVLGLITKTGTQTGRLNSLLI